MTVHIHYIVQYVQHTSGAHLGSCVEVTSRVLLPRMKWHQWLRHFSQVPDVCNTTVPTPRLPKTRTSSTMSLSSKKCWRHWSSKSRYIAHVMVVQWTACSSCAFFLDFVVVNSMVVVCDDIVRLSVIYFYSTRKSWSTISAVTLTGWALWRTEIYRYCIVCVT